MLYICYTNSDIEVSFVFEGISDTFDTWIRDTCTYDSDVENN